jgi:hypothetical protein
MAMITTILIIALVVLLVSGTIGWHSQTIPPASPLGLLLIVVVVLLVVALLGPVLYPVHPVALPVR